MAISKNSETIAAIATPSGKGGVGIIRISGQQATSIAEKILGQIPSPRTATYSHFYSESGEEVDRGIAILFKQPNSFTGEDVLELQGHGGTAVMQMLLSACLEAGARLAEPGEFTKRAFLNGKLDLLQAEGVADLIAATSKQAARSALRSMEGEFSNAINKVVLDLIELRAISEAELDFPEEEIERSSLDRRQNMLSKIITATQSLVDKAKQGALLREGANIAIVGNPNVGKSSLLNALAEDDVAIVSDIPGTTRDAIRQAIEIEGVTLHLVDTAGIRETDDVVERIGLERTRTVAKKADLLLWLRDVRDINGEEHQSIPDLFPLDAPTITIFNKIDLLKQSEVSHIDAIFISVKEKRGLNVLKERILQMIGWHGESGIYMARQRHLEALASAHDIFLRALSSIKRQEVFCEELRRAQNALNTITGEFSSDDLLGEIFGKFCIGK